MNEILVIGGFGVLLFFFFIVVPRAFSKQPPPMVFNNNTEAILFARKHTDCSIKLGKPLIAVAINDYDLIEMAMINMKLIHSETPSASFYVNILTDDGFFKRLVTCTRFTANIRKGDLIAVIPTSQNKILAIGESDPRKAWVFVAVAKLKPIYKNKKDGWIIDEMLIDLN